MGPRRPGRLLADHDGVLRRADVLAHVDHAILDQALRSGRLVRAYPGVYLDRVLAGSRDALVRGALAYADGHAALSHVTALAAWRVPAPDDGPIHLTTSNRRHLRGVPGLVVHRRSSFAPGPPHAVFRGGLPVTRLERSLVDSWPLLDGDRRRAPLIRAVADRLTTPERLQEALPNRRIRSQRELSRLVELLAAGCHSELELWGYDHVASPRDRERDLRRDALLAARGILVVRFGHDRLVGEPSQVRREVLDILRARRHWRPTALRSVG